MQVGKSMVLWLSCLKWILIGSTNGVRIQFHIWKEKYGIKVKNWDNIGHKERNTVIENSILKRSWNGSFLFFFIHSST